MISVPGCSLLPRESHLSRWSRRTRKAPAAFLSHEENVKLF
ncbi:hypothetical protein [Fictibacillus sp. KU28468]|nr:hypothetical protein [Fictibacillus sp. KU28468]UZJ78327.1 hypothetical protein OKX00_19705 [Fictibacillus sp. KU28468]